MKSSILILLTGLIYLTNYNLHAQNAPISTIGAIETYDDSATVFIRVSGFSNITGCDLKINYDPEIVVVTSVSEGPNILHNFFIPDFTEPGTIDISWFYYNGLTIPNDSVFLIINFDRIIFGNSAVEFINSVPGYCLWINKDGIILNDIPYSTYYIDGSLNFKMIDAPLSSLPIIENCPGLSLVDVPVFVSEFNQIGAFTLTLQYDETTFTYQSFTNDSGFPNLYIVESNPGVIVVEGLSGASEGITLSNNSVLFTIHLDNLGGSSAFAWLDQGESCIFKGPSPLFEPRNDAPQSSFYVDGSVTELPMPTAAGSIAGPLGGIVCQGDSNVAFSITPIPFATDYEWELPAGAVIESGDGTPEILVSFSISAFSGELSVHGINECGNGSVSPAFPINIETMPVIGMQPVSPDTVIAGNGVANFSVSAMGSDLSYQWQEFTTFWTDILDGEIYTGALTEQLTITNPPITLNGNKYRCVINGNCEPPAISDGNATLSVAALTGFNIPDFGINHGDNCLRVESFPNPFYDKITFTYNTPSKGEVIIEISNIYGERVVVLTNKIETKGKQMQSFDSQQLSQGIYMAVVTFKSEKTIMRNLLKIISNKQ